MALPDIKLKSFSPYLQQRTIIVLKIKKIIDKQPNKIEEIILLDKIREKTLYKEFQNIKKDKHQNSEAKSKEFAN